SPRCDDSELPEPIGYSVKAPDVVMLPIWFAAASANHSLPSGPGPIPSGSLPGVGMSNSVTSPAVVILPILFPEASVNQRLPSGPAVIPPGLLDAVGMANSVI